MFACGGGVEALWWYGCGGVWSWVTVVLGVCGGWRAAVDGESGGVWGSCGGVVAG